MHGNNENSRYANKTMINRPVLLNNLLNTKLKHNSQIRDCIAEFKSQHSRLAALNSPIEEQVKVATLLSSLGEREEGA